MEKRSELAIGLLSFGGFVLIVGFTLFIYPDTFTKIGTFIKDLVDQKAWSRPPYPLPEAASLFVISIGVLSFVVASVRLVAGQPWYKALQDVSWGIAMVFLGYLFLLYAQETIRARLIPPMFLIIGGILIVANVLFRYFYALSKGLVR